MTDRISGGAFKDMVAFGAACIAQQKQAINDLNVFPVPDGDTGTNMSLTIQTAVAELRKVHSSSSSSAGHLYAPASVSVRLISGCVSSTVYVVPSPTVNVTLLFSASTLPGNSPLPQ